MQTDRLPHALLLVGASGLGTRRFAERLTQVLLCERPALASSGPSACGECAACLQVRDGAHPGYRCLQRDSEGKARDIPVDAVRNACAFLALTAAAARAKVLLIDRADDLNASGFNALLKTIEEPTSKSYVIMTSESPGNLPATIRSRCQMLRFSAPPQAQAMEYLAVQLPQRDVAARAQALRDTLGAPLAALELLADTERLKRYETWSVGIVGPSTDAAHSLQDASLPTQRDTASEYGRYAAIIAWHQAREALVQHTDTALALRINDEAIRALQHLEANGQPRLTLESFTIGCIVAHRTADSGTSRR